MMTHNNGLFVWPSFGLLALLLAARGLTADEPWLAVEKPDPTQKSAEGTAEQSTVNPADKATGDPLADDLKSLQGTWQVFEKAPNGNVLRVVREVQGNKETLRMYDEANAVLHEHHVDFRLEQSGKVRLYTYFNYRVTAGPWKGKWQPKPVSYVYRLNADVFIEAPGLLVGDVQDPGVRIWKRVKKTEDGVKEKPKERSAGTRT